MSELKHKFWAMSLYGAKTRKPIVALRHEDWVLQVSPDIARSIAKNIVEAAEASEQDAFLVEWIKKTCRVDDECAATFLCEFREWKEQRTKG